MSDNLRDRIAAVLAAHQFRITGESDQPMCCECQEGCSRDGYMLTMEPQDHPQHVADAVIRELGLRKASRPSDYGYVQYPAGDRYITDWIKRNTRNER